MGRRILLFLSLVILASLIAAGCQAPTTPPAPTPPPTPAPTPTPTPAPAPTPTPTPTQVQPIKLKWSHGVPPNTVFQKEAFEPWAKIIKERTTAIGKPVEITFYPAGALAKLYDQYDLLISGGADIVSNWGPTHFIGRMPLGEALDLPFLFPSSSVAALVAQELFDTRPEFKKQFDEAKVIAFHPSAPMHLNSRERQIKTLEDLKGLRSVVRGGPDANTVKALGGIPVTLQMPETYEALQRGTVDVGFLNWEGVYSFKWYEVTKARTQLPRGMYLTFLVVSMNWNAYKNLPPDVQKIFDELTGPYLSKLSTEAMDKAQGRTLATIKEYDKKSGNPEVYEMPANEFQRWLDAVNPLYEAWIKGTEAKGLPARAVLDDVQRLIKKYAK